MAVRGEDALRFGPLKPVGLRDPRTGSTPHAVVNCARRPPRAARFTGRLSDAADLAGAERSLRKIAGLAHAEWLRLGVMHRNTFIDAPRLLDGALRLRGIPVRLRGPDHRRRRIRRGGRVRGIAGIGAARELPGSAGAMSPPRPALGAVIAHSQNTTTADFQPSNVTWAAFPRDRTAQRRRAQARQAARPRPDGRTCAGRVGRRLERARAHRRRPATPRSVARGTSLKRKFVRRPSVAVRRDGKLAMAGDGR